MTASTLPANPDERNALLAKLVAEVSNGKSFAQLAEEYGVPRSTINNWLLSKVPEQYEDAKQAGIVARITESVEKLETSDSHLDVSRAREVAKLWCWIAERQVRSFAPKQELSGPGGGPIQVMDDLERARRAQFVRNLDPIDVEVVQPSPTTSAST